MKKVLLLLAGLAMIPCAQAQYILTGTSYTQNFDNISGGLPQGWEVDTGATATYKGTPVLFDTTRVPWNQTTAKFKNFAAKDTFSWNTSTANQNAATNRALGLRQTSTFANTGGAFVFQIANTSNLSNFNLSFKLMSLDSTSARVTTWVVDYATGANPSNFTPVATTGTMTTGGNTFSSATITANFGTALNNQAGPVWIRIVTLTPTTGANNRASTGIDDFSLTWTGAGVTSPRPTIVTLSPSNSATNVPTTANLLLIFNKAVTKGTTGNFYIKNETDQTTLTKPASSNDVNASGGNTVIISNVGLLPGKTYHVTFDSAAIDSGGFKSYGIYDTTTWRFTTVPPVVNYTSLNEQFDTSCGSTNGLPMGWLQYSVTGSQTWRCSGTSTAPNFYMTMNGGNSTSSTANEDWLISPRVNLSAMTTPQLLFRTRYRFFGDNLQVLVSSNYTGNGDPNNATWTDLNIATYDAADSNQWVTKRKDLTNYKSAPVYVAFRYMSTTTSARQWDVDSVLTIDEPLAVRNVSKGNNLPVTVLGNATNGHVQIGFDLPKSATLQAAIYDVAGREVYRETVSGEKGGNRVTLQPQSLQSGVYIIRLTNGERQGVVRTFIQ